jgi:hypothetical protein
MGGPRNSVDPIEKNTCCSCREWNQLLRCPVRNATTIVTISGFFNHLKSRDYRINTSCKITKFCMFPIQVTVFCIPIIIKRRSFSYTLTDCFLNENGMCSMWDKNLTLIWFKQSVLKELNKKGRQQSFTLISNNGHLPTSYIFITPDYEGSRYVGVIYQNSQRPIPDDRNFDTAREPLISHTNSVLSKWQQNLRCH